MRIKSSKTICFFLAVLALLSGIYFENIKMDSSFVCAPAGVNASRFLAYPIINDAKACTTEMLEVHSSIGLQQLAGRYISQKREIKAPLDFLCSGFFSLLEERFFTGSKLVRFFHQKPHGLVTSYIHRSDGKKRV